MGATIYGSLVPRRSDQQRISGVLKEGIMAQSSKGRTTIDYDSFWTVPPRPVPTWQTERYRYNFGGANPGPDVMPIEELAEAARAAWGTGWGGVR